MIIINFCSAFEIPMTKQMAIPVHILKCKTGLQLFYMCVYTYIYVTDTHLSIQWLETYAYFGDNINGNNRYLEHLTHTGPKHLKFFKHACIHTHIYISIQREKINLLRTCERDSLIILIYKSYYPTFNVQTISCKMVLNPTDGLAKIDWVNAHVQKKKTEWPRLGTTCDLTPWSLATPMYCI